MFSFQSTLTQGCIKVNKANVSLCISCVKNSRGCRRCWCTCVHVDDPEHGDAFLHPREKFHSVTAAHTRWLSKEGQVVVLSAAQSSVDAAHADICLPWLLQGEEKSAFPYACARCNPFLHPLPLPPSSASPPSPVLTRWLPEHCLPWVTVPDAECVHRHPHSAQLVFSFLRSLLAEMPVEALILRRVCHSSTHFSTFAIYPSYLHIFPLTFIKSTLRTTSASVCFSDQVFLSPSSLVFHALCLCWHMGAPLCRRAEDRNRPPDVTGAENQMYLAPLGRVPQKHVHPTSWSSPLRSPQNTRYKIQDTKYKALLISY